MAEDRRLAMQEARKSRVYLKKVAAKRTREAKANAYRSQLAKELRNDAVARIKAAATGSGFLAAEKIAQIEAAIEGVHSCQAGTQTEKVRVISEADWQLLQRVKAPQIAADTKSAQCVTNPQSEAPLFKVSTPQGELLLTKPEFNELKLHCPQAKVASTSILHRAKDNLRTKIRRRVSSKYRKMKDMQQARWLLTKKGYKADQLPKVPRYRQTATIKRLVFFFQDKVEKLGFNKGMPVQPEESDPEQTDDEYFNRVVALYNRKTHDYKANISKAQHSRVAAKSTQKVYSNTEAAKAHCLPYLKAQGKEAYVSEQEEQQMPEINDQNSASESPQGEELHSNPSLRESQGETSPDIKSLHKRRRRPRKKAKVSYRDEYESSSSEEDAE